MENTYFTIVTDSGTKKMFEALNEEKKVSIAEFAVGDGGGEAYSPTKEMEALKNEVWRGSVKSCYVSEESENLLITESVIPSDVGGFTIREMGIFDTEGTLIAICNTPETHKVKITDGVVHEMTLSMEIALSNTDSVELIVDPAVVTATKKDVERLGSSLEKKIEEEDNATYRQATGYTDTKIAELINSAPSTLDTLGEIAQAMQDNADVVEALEAAMGNKAPQAEVDGHTSNSTIHITASERTNWDNHMSEKATANSFGHVKLSDTFQNALADGDAANGVGASQKALADAYAELSGSLGGITFGMDADGNYGYIKAGADTVTPFKGGLEISETIHNDTSGYRNNTLYAATVTKGRGFCNISAACNSYTVTVTIGSHTWTSGKVETGKIEINECDRIYAISNASSSIFNIMTSCMVSYTQ